MLSAVHFGTVYKINAFKTPKGGSLRSEARKHEVAQEILYKAETASMEAADKPGMPPFVMSLPATRNGKEVTDYYYIENGPNDADADNLDEQLTAHNDKWVSRLQAEGALPSAEDREDGGCAILPPGYRQQMIEEKLAVIRPFAAKATQQLNIVLNEDGSYETANIRPIKK